MDGAGGLGGYAKVQLSLVKSDQLVIKTGGSGGNGCFRFNWETAPGGSAGYNGGSNGVAVTSTDQWWSPANSGGGRRRKNRYYIKWE